MRRDDGDDDVDDAVDENGVMLDRKRIGTRPRMMESWQRVDRTLPLLELGSDGRTR